MPGVYEIASETQTNAPERLRRRLKRYQEGNLDIHIFYVLRDFFGCRHGTLQSGRQV